MRLTALLVAVAALAAGLLASSVSPPAARAQLAGVQIHPLWAGVEPDDVARDLDAASRAGADLVRVDVGWASLEQTARGRREGWYLHRVDAVVDAARRRGLRVLVTFMSSPCWASSAPADRSRDCAGAWWERGVQHYAPRDPQDYADALAFLVRRYGDRVAAWEVWNEPNDRAFFRAADPAAAYAALLRTAYAEVKRADPHAVVLGGVLAEADADFTERLYAAGVKGAFDGWAIHPYTGDRSPADGADGGALVRGVRAVRDVLVRHGDDKPLWLTELGWSTATRRGGQAWENGVSAARQAGFLEQALDRVRGLPYVRAAVWFNLRDTSDDPADRVGNYGLLREDWSAKPAYAAFARAAARLNRPRTARATRR